MVAVYVNAWLAFIIGVLVVTGSILIYVVLSGVPFYGLAAADEETLAAVIFIVAIILGLILYAAIKAQFRRIKTGKEALVGAKGVATTDLRPKGEVRVMGEFWAATAKEATITAGQAVEVVDMDGMTLVVKPAEQKA